MIPKKIHYCWFGRGEKPKLAQKCIASWEKYCPDYEIVEWNEDNFDLDSNAYVREAYNSRKYAFVTDYVRLFVMLKYGGIYMDTDVEVVSSLDKFLYHQAFSGFEEDGWIPTGLMACEKGFPLFQEFLEYYSDAHFVNADGTLNMETNTNIMTRIAVEHGLVKNGLFQVVDGFALYPKEVFCPLENATGKLKRTKQTATIHWFSKSWVPTADRRRLYVTRIVHRWFGKDSLRWLKNLLNVKGRRK